MSKTPLLVMAFLVLVLGELVNFHRSSGSNVCFALLPFDNLVRFRLPPVLVLFLSALHVVVVVNTSVSAVGVPFRCSGPRLSWALQGWGELWALPRSR